MTKQGKTPPMTDTAHPLSNPVTMTDAIFWAGVSRPTFYARKKAGAFSTVQDQSGNPMMDVSEIMRVFPDTHRIGKINTPNSELNKLDLTQSNTANSQPNTLELERLRMENELLKQRVEELKADKEKAESREDKHLETIKGLTDSVRLLEYSKAPKSLLDRLKGVFKG